MYEAIIKNVMGFFSYFVPGFIFLSCYQYAACLPREKEKEYLIIKSVAISYFLNLTVEFVSRFFHCASAVESAVSLFLIFLLSILTGFILGGLHKSRWVNEQLQKLFGREVENNLFVDLWIQSAQVDKVLSVEITMKNTNEVYLGQVYKIVQYNTDPIIILCSYMCIDSNEKIITDRSDDGMSYAVIHYSDVLKMEYTFLS